MIITCPNCATQFEIPDEAYRPGRKARCSKCGHVFVLPVSQEEPADFPFMQPAEAAPQPDNAASRSLPDELASAGDMPDAAGDATPQETPPPASPDDILPPGATSDATPDASQNAGGKKPKFWKRAFWKNKKVLIGAAAALVLLLVVVGALAVSSLFSSSDSDPVSDRPLNPNALREFGIKKPIQYSVNDNMVTGKMYVVEGSIRNNSGKNKDLILVKVSLFNKKGELLLAREQYCGVTLSVLQLRSLSKDAIERALADKKTIFRNNLGIPPGSEVPFTVVFFAPPRDVFEYEIDVIDAKDAQ